MKIKQLTGEDFELYQNMETGLEDDYMLRAFERLTTPPEHYLYGLIKDNQLVTIAGFSMFPGGYAMLGRLRSDKRFRGSGHATYLIEQLIDLLKKSSDINWFGGYTNINNLPARQILKKLGIPKLKKYYSFPLVEPDLLEATRGNIWSSISEITEKRQVLEQLSKDVLTIYPLECYYPFPYRQELITDQKLAETRFYHNDRENRWLLISDDIKGAAYAQVRYFWDDYFTQPGLFETVVSDLKRSDQPQQAWFDFTTEAFAKIPNKQAFEVQDGWILYGMFLK